MTPRPPNASRPRLLVLRGVTRPALLPYVLLVAALLVLGSLALLVLNTALSSGDITRQQLEQRQTRLDQQADALRQRLQQVSAPSALASSAARLGMVPVPDPAFLDLKSGRVLGDPQRATPTPSATPSQGAGR